MVMDLKAQQMMGQPQHLTATMGGMYIDPKDFYEQGESDGVRN